MSSQKTNWSRRDFLKAAGTAGLGAIAAPIQQIANASDSQNMVPTRPFGKSGVNVSILSLGGMFNIKSNQMMLKQAMRWDVTYWDTADCYQRGSEKGIGKYFKKYPKETRMQLTQADYTLAEQKCPKKIAIGRLMREAKEELS